MLDREYIKTEVNGNDIVIGGIYAYAFGYDGSGHMDKSKISRKTLNFLESFQAEDSFKIMMAHRPESFLFGDAKETWDIDLVLSGHLHGGQVIVPFKGGLYGGDFGWFPQYAFGEFHFSAVKGTSLQLGKVYFVITEICFLGCLHFCYVLCYDIYSGATTVIFVHIPPSL